jgi:transposase-like protein
MERADLARMLDDGWSLERIGQRYGKNPSTVSYWLKKYGLTPVFQEKHRAKGALGQAALESRIQAGATVRSIAEELRVAEPTVRYWLRKYGLRTHRAERRRQARFAHDAQKEATQMVCPHHGLTDHWLEGRGSYRCLRCRWAAVARRRRKVKRILIDEAGGRCQLCGYDRCVGALHFHHVDPTTKSFALSVGGWTRSLEKTRAEANKCVLLCGNCHAEVEAGVAKLHNRE